MLFSRNLALLLALLCPCIVWAKKPPAAKAPVHQPLISRPMQLLAQDNFDRAALGPNWRVVHGDAGLEQGELKTIPDEDDEDHLQKGTALADFVRKSQNVGVVCRVKNVSSNLMVIGIARADQGTGFVVAVHISKKGRVAVIADHGVLATADELLEDVSEWIDVMFEVVGPRIVVQVNGKKVIDAETPAIQRSPKRGIAFCSVKGEARMDNLMVGEIAPK